jgi:hypothetical protein
MKKRVTAGVLWFFSGWYAWSMVATFIGVTTALGPVFGVLAALLIAGDPFGRIWTSPSEQPARLTAASVGEPG